jgi:MFS superfamily sulfate permease-like transporter
MAITVDPAGERLFAARVDGGGRVNVYDSTGAKTGEILVARNVIAVRWDSAHNELVAIVVMMVNVAFGIMGFKTVTDVKAAGDTVTVAFSGPAVYTSLIAVRGMLDKLPGGKKVVIDFSKAGLIDHTVREKLNDFSAEYARDTGGTVTMAGTQNHTATCHHELATLVRN